MDLALEDRRVDVGGLRTRYLTAGDGPPLVLVHGAGESALDWSWVMPALARTHRVYAPDLPGFGDSAKPAAAYSSAFFERFLAGFLDTLEIERAALVGNSLGGITALRVASAQPARVTALGLVDSGGLGRAVNPGQIPLLLPGVGELGNAWARTPPGAVQRAWWHASLLFARPARAPAAWLAEQRRLARLPGYLEATLAAQRAAIGPGGQREVLLDRLPHLPMPTLVIWGAADRVFPAYQARAAIEHLREGHLVLMPACGHLPHVEEPEQFVAALGPFLHERAGAMPSMGRR